MPKVEKQNPSGNRVHPTPKQTQQLKPEDDLVRGLKLSVYGRSKTGKTRLACSFPKPLLLMGTEDGTNSIATGRIRRKVLGLTNYSLTIRGDEIGIDFMRLDQVANLETCIELLKTRYKSGALDTAGGLQDLILKELLGFSDSPIQRTWGMASQQDWGTVGIQMKERLRSLLDLADQQGINIVIIAHERNFGEDSNSEIMIPSVGSAVSPSVAGWLNGSCDYIAQAFIRQKEVEVTGEVAGKKITTKEIRGVEYCLRVGTHPVYMSGFRLPPGFVLPDVISDPDYVKIADIIQGNGEKYLK